MKQHLEVNKCYDGSGQNRPNAGTKLEKDDLVYGYKATIRGKKYWFPSLTHAFDAARHGIGEYESSLRTAQDRLSPTRPDRSLLMRMHCRIKPNAHNPAPESLSIGHVRATGS